ncbi:MAG: hypothetical protein EU530_01865 [Promethearchaeota archaeon]|nr:MAG: hypothetical protein EU530_01865 [Candidatus Lokiarchaeota archaeon]
MSKKRSSYIEGSVEEYFRNLVKLMNEISSEPLNEENNQRIRVPFFPFVWDLNQVYLIFKEVYNLKLFDNMGFIITRRDYSEIKEAFLFKFNETDEEEIGTGQARFKYEIIPLNIRKHQKSFKELSNLVAKFDVKAFKFVQNFALKEFNFKLGLLFILPEHIAHLGVQENIDYINSDVVRYFKDFFGLLRKGLTEEMTKMPVIELSSKANRNNPLVNLFIKFASEWSGVNINQLFDLFTKLMEGLTMNLLIVNKDKNPISIGRIVIENGIIHMNPVPLEFIKEHFGESGTNNISELAKHLYNRTKTNTLTIDVAEFYKFLLNFNKPEYTVLTAFLDIIELSSQYGTYPESIFSRLLSEIGIDVDKLIKRLKDTIKSVIKYYERILVGTLTVNSKGLRELNSLFYIGVSETGNLIHKQLNPRSYKQIFENKQTTIAINELEEKVKEKTKLEFPLIAIVKMKILTEILNLQNLQSIVEMSRFRQNLPSLEKLAGILGGLSHEDLPLEESSIEAVEKEESNGSFIDDIPSINHFLTKGITIKTSKDKTVIYKRDKEFREKGYLGLDVKKLKEFIKNKFPEILLD